MFHSQIFRVPYSVTIDEVKETIVVAVRGTLSLKVKCCHQENQGCNYHCPLLQDALTDVSFQLHHIDVIKDDGTGKKELMLDTYVHEVRWSYYIYLCGASKVCCKDNLLVL